MSFYQTFYSLRLSSYFDIFHLAKPEFDFALEDSNKYGVDSIIVPVYYKYLARLPLIPVVVSHIYQLSSLAFGPNIMAPPIAVHALLKTKRTNGIFNIE